MGKPKKTKVTQPSNQQRITSFFSSAPAPSQSVKRPPPHNAGVSPVAKRDCTSPTPGKENKELLTCKKNLTDDLGQSASPWQSPRQLKAVPQTNGSVTKGGVTDSSASQAKQSPRSALHTRRKGQLNNKNGSQRPRNILSSLLSKSVSSANVPVKHPAAKLGNQDEVEVVFLSDSDDLSEEEPLFSLSGSSCEAFTNALPTLDQERHKTDPLSDSENSHQSSEPGKLLRGTSEGKQSTSSNSSEDFSSSSRFGKSSSGKEEEEAATISDCSEDLFGTPNKTKGKKTDDRLTGGLVDLKQDDVTSSDDELTSGIVVNVSFPLGVESREGFESIMRAAQDTKPEEEEDLDATPQITTDVLKSSQDSSISGDDELPKTSTDIFKSSQDSSISDNNDSTPKTITEIFKSSQESSINEDNDSTSHTTTDIFKSSQDSSISEDIGSDILDASQGFGIKRNATGDAEEAEMHKSESIDPKPTADDIADAMETQDSNGEALGKISMEMEAVEFFSTSGKTKEKVNGKLTDEDLGHLTVPDCTKDSVLSVNGTPDAAETKSAGNKTPKKLSADEENDCLDILEMFGELSPFKEKPASKPVHGLLESDPIMKKFLDEGKNKESFVAQNDFGRHLVLAAERDTSTRTTHLQLLSSENVKRTCTLAGTWSDTVVRDGDIIHILLTNPVDNHYHIDNNQGLVVVHPDLLVSSTSVAAGVFCRRRAVLAERYRGMEPPSIIMTVGSLVHELFQEAVVEAMRGGTEQLSEGRLQAMVNCLLGRPKVLEELYRLNQTADALRQDMAGFIPKVLAWCSRYLGKAGQAEGSGSYKWQGRITHVEEVEENIWCPRLGLKGKVDMVVQAEARGGPVTLPLELKTGRASFSSEHCGQLALYAMMGTDRRPDPGAGLLLYLREGAMEEKVAPVKERRDLICLRNDLAAHLAVRPKAGRAAGAEPSLLPLPPPIAHERGCQQCPHKVTCAVHQVVQDEVPAAPHPMADLVPQHTAHLTSQHLDYFRHWCLLYQLEAAESVGGSGALWCRNAVRREEEGECLAWLVLGTTPPVEVRRGCFLHTLVRGRRHPGSATPLASVGLQAGNLVIASSSRVLALASGSVQGFRDGAVLVELDKPLQGGVAHHYHLDLNSSTNFLRLPMQTLGRLLLPEPRAEALRRLVVDRSPPAFKKRVPSKVLECKPMLAHLNAAQKRAVVRTLAAEDYVLVQGFPGTGKSTTLATIVRVLLQLGRSVLITAYTNTALDSLLLKLHKLGIDFMRVGRSDRVHPDLVRHTDQARTGRLGTVEELAELYASQRVVAATCLGLGHSIFSRRTFDICIVDEAAQVLQVTALGPLFLCSTFVLVGDDKQLPPVVRSESAVLHGMTETLFERLNRPEVTVTLAEQYRMNGPIMALANSLTYDNQLTCATPQLEQATLDLPHYQRLVGEGGVAPWLQRVVAPTLEEAVVLVDTAGAAGEARVTGSSLANHREARLVMVVVRTLLKAGLSANDIGVITPYRGQVNLVKKLLAEEVKEEEDAGKRVEVNTVDQYQGRDKMAIICSFVRCGKSNDKPAGILTDHRRLNVALTRAKRKLILIGDQVTLTRYTSFSCLMKVLATHQLYCLTPGTDGFQWEEEECQDVEAMEVEK